MKIKNSVKKKLLTGLLIGTTLSGVVSTNVFAYSNSGNGDYASKEQSDKIINEIKQEYRARSSRLQYKQYDDPMCWLVGLRNDMYLISGFGRVMVGRWKVENNVYYFDRNTLKAQKGWYNVTDSNGYNGRYYFNPQDYSAIKGGVYAVGNEKFYFDVNGKICKGLTHAGSNTYFGDSRAGVLVNGWYSTGGHRYLFERSNNSAAHTGWYQDGNKGSMYFYYDGTMAEGVTRVGNDTYLFLHQGRDANAHRAIGYYSDTMTDKRYYFDPSTGKAAKNKWMQTGCGSMYFCADGAMAKGVTKIGNDTYVFTKGRGHDYNYYKDHGWYTDQETGKRYYFDKYNDGKAVKGIQRIDGRDWSFDREGVLLGVLN